MMMMKKREIFENGLSEGAKWMVTLPFVRLFSDTPNSEGMTTIFNMESIIEVLSMATLLWVRKLMVNGVNIGAIIVDTRIRVSERASLPL